ncbi:MAG TPA: sigma-54 dependent transcriptional regulator [bacterium]|nr:sigma-54 dependent transcriptional regulator [bacterium]HQG44852.1 sigma-54 dependent transcriptional regulator [bacterium]HQI48449.1 sigma-54 dependent transcriptional regulator [bacterium]HQJ63895.1 sigma-54 dependent transcriptional regulator [bacterium]
MNSRPAARVLVIDDELHILKTIGISLESIGFTVTLTSRPQDALEIASSEHFDLAFVDLRMQPIDGMEMLERLRRLDPDLTVVIITAHGTIDSAVEAVKKGAYHYLQKPFDLKELQIFAQKAWEHHHLASEVRALREQVTQVPATGEFITRNAEMLALLELAGRLADSTMSVLIEGESGTGKELIAHFIHNRSTRADKPFVKINCAALPEELLESELFGHIKGAFTGATRDRQGRFELADGGTIFLDEVAEISPAIQAKLLRVIQSKEFERVGESVTRKVDVRIIAATNRDLDEALREGSFRDDLFYRLNAVRLKATALRQRPEDIPLLVHHFIRKFGKEPPAEITIEAMKALRLYRWFGNVRELENVMERAVLLAGGGTIELSHLPEEVQHGEQTPVYALSLEEVEKRHIIQVLEHAQDYDEAARILGIDPATLWRKRKKYRL